MDGAVVANANRKMRTVFHRYLCISIDIDGCAVSGKLALASSRDTDGSNTNPKNAGWGSVICTDLAW
jgi:hypothetical protein